MEESTKFQTIDKAVKYFKQKGFEVIDVDGARVIFENGWGLIRASNTSPKITIRYEAKDETELKKIEAEFEKCLAEIM